MLITSCFRYQSLALPRPLTSTSWVRVATGSLSRNFTTSSVPSATCSQWHTSRNHDDKNICAGTSPWLIMSQNYSSSHQNLRRLTVTIPQGYQQSEQFQKLLRTHPTFYQEVRWKGGYSKFGHNAKEISGWTVLWLGFLVSVIIVMLLDWKYIGELTGWNFKRIRYILFPEHDPNYKKEETGRDQVLTK